MPKKKKKKKKKKQLYAGLFNLMSALTRYTKPGAISFFNFSDLLKTAIMKNGKD